MTCTWCEKAKADPRRDDWAPGGRCEGCKGRAFAAVGMYVQQALAEDMSIDYRQALERMFGERWQQGHVKVRFWTQVIVASTARMKASEVMK